MHMPRTYVVYVILITNVIITGVLMFEQVSSHLAVK